MACPSHMCHNKLRMAGAPLSVCVVHACKGQGMGVKGCHHLLWSPARSQVLRNGVCWAYCRYSLKQGGYRGVLGQKTWRCARGGGSSSRELIALAE